MCGWGWGGVWVTCECENAYCTERWGYGGKYGMQMGYFDLIFRALMISQWGWRGRSLAWKYLEAAAVRCFVVVEKRHSKISYCSRNDILTLRWHFLCLRTVVTPRSSIAYCTRVLPFSMVMSLRARPFLSVRVYGSVCVCVWETYPRFRTWLHTQPWRFRSLKRYKPSYYNDDDDDDDGS